MMKYYRLVQAFLLPLLGVWIVLSCCISCRRDAPADGTASLDGDVECCRALFNEARDLQHRHQYLEAIALYRQCASYTADNEREVKQLQPVIVDALLQLMNSYQSMGQPNECVLDLNDLLRHPTPLISRYCLRDLYSLLGYALSRTEAMREAEEAITKALSLPMSYPTHERFFRDYAFAAAIHFSNPDKQEQVIQWCNMAIDESRLCSRPPGIQWVTSMLGTLYKRTGRIDESIDLFTQSVQESHRLHDVLGEANACNSLTDLYLYWGMPSYANAYANRSLNILANASHDNPMIQAASLLLKGRTMEELHRTDSAVLFWQQAEQICQKLPYNSGQVDVDFLWGQLQADSTEGDSFRQGMERLRKVSREGTLTVRAKAFFGLAKGYIRHQEYALGEAMLDSMYRQLHLSPQPLYVENANYYALQHFVRQGNLAQIARYAEALLGEQAQSNEKQLSRKLAENIVRFQMEKKEQELRLAQSRLSNIRIYFILAGSIFLLLICLAFFAIRLNRVRRRLMERQLDGLKNNLDSARQHNAEIKSQLTNLLADIAERNQLEAATPQLLRDKGEQRFRQRFEQFYPTFLLQLRSLVPGITRNEELLCMLIALGQDTFQIEQQLGIAHRSVIMARHRLRKKITLDESTTLEQFIQNLLLNEKKGDVVLD